MPVELISPGPVTTLLANVIYALPASPCMIDAGAVLQKSPTYAGTYTNWPGSDTGIRHEGGGHCKCTTGNTTVVATKIKMKDLKPSALPYDQVILADSPSNYWKLNDLGNPIVDSVGGANGTGAGGVGPGQAGAISSGTSMSFNGTTGKITTAAKTLPTPYTFEAWFKTSSGTVQIPIFSTRNPPDGLNNQIFVGLLSGQVFCFLNFASGVSGTRIVNDGQWHHLVVIFGGISVIIYLDGVQDANSTFSASYIGTTAHSLEIGFDTAELLYWPGFIDEVAIYPYALSAARVLAHYQAR